jgi:hypothetical protein
MTSHSKSRVVTNSQLKIKNGSRYESSGPARRGRHTSRARRRHARAFPLPLLKKVSWLPKHELCRKSVRTGILRDYSGITVIDHLRGNQSGEGRWSGIDTMATQSTGNIYSLYCMLCRVIFPVGETDTIMCFVPNDGCRAARAFYVHLSYKDCLGCRMSLDGRSVGLINYQSN